MAITSIERDWGNEPGIVRLTTTDNLATITATGYLTDQADILQALVNGTYQWVDTDIVAISHSGGNGFFVRNVVTQAFDLITITPGEIDNDDIEADAEIAFSKLEDLASGQILVGSAGNVPTAVTMSGDATMTNAGVVTVAGSAPAATYQNTVTISITAADVIAAYTTPKVLVAAPAAGFRYIVTSVQYDILYGTAQFTGGGLFGVQINNTANGLGKAVHNFLAGGQLNAASENSVYTTVSTALSGDSADYVAQGIYFSNKTAAFATGDSNIDIHITYSTVATAA